jgi:hypothetical protein
MDKYHENGPLPTWIGWTTQQRLPHSFHAATVAYTLLAELFVAWLVFLPKQSRRIAFAITTPLQIGIILTANYAFLNYLVLFLGVLLLVPPPPPAPEPATPSTKKRSSQRSSSPRSSPFSCPTSLSSPSSSPSASPTASASSR